MTLNQFAKKLAVICNESQLLYADMIDQEYLFDLQENLIDLLIEANNDGKITHATMLEFEHVFTTK